MVFDTIKIAREYQSDVRREWDEIRGKREAKEQEERRKYEKTWSEWIKGTAQKVMNYLNGEFGEPTSSDYKDLLLCTVLGDNERLKMWTYKFGKVEGAVDCRSPLDRKTALMLAAHNRDDAAVTILINSNATPTISDCFGKTALHYACASQDPECAELILIAGADVDARDAEGKTPLMEAAQGSAIECVDVLCEYGASLDLRDKVYKWTALHFAAHAGNVEAVELLLDSGASIISRSRLGETAHDVALNRHNKECAILLHDWKLEEFMDSTTIPASSQREASPFSAL